MGAHTWKERLRYRIDRFFQSGFALQLVIASFIVVAVILLFAAGAELLKLNPGEDFGSDDGPFWPSARFWWVITHTLETYWIEQSLAAQITSVVLTLFNLLVFAAVVGLVGSKIQERLENMRRGTSRAIEEGHYVIVGWSEKVLPVVQEFHSGYEGGKLVLAILSERPIDEVEYLLRKKLKKRKGLRLVIRQGRGTEIGDLQLVSVATARAVIVLKQSSASASSDPEIVKTIMGIEYVVASAGTRESKRPFVVAEIERSETETLARAAANGMQIVLVHPMDALGKIILQTARQPGLVAVYDEILQHSGSEVHTAPASNYPALAGADWASVTFAFPGAIPFGVQRSGRTLLTPHANNPGFTLEPGDRIFFLSRDSDSLRADFPVNVPNVVLPARDDSHSDATANVLLVGFNDKAPHILKEYNAYAASVGRRFTLTMVSPLPEAQTMMNMTDVDSIDITVRQADYLEPGVLEEIGLEAFDSIIVLSEVTTGGLWEGADTRVIMTLLLLRDMRRRAEKAGKSLIGRCHTVGEIRHVYNRELAESTQTIRDVIISETLISKMIAQICRDPYVEGAIRDFFDEQGAELYLKPIRLYAPLGKTVSFAVLLAASLQRGETAIGVAAGSDHAPHASVTLNPSRSDIFHLVDDMRLIVIAEKEG